MREIISVFLETNAPLATSKRQPQINAEDREQLLNTFTRTVFSSRPPIDIAYRCMRLDLWSWTEQALVAMEGQEVPIDEMLRQYLDTMKASRNAERLYHLWRGSANSNGGDDECGGGENYVVTEKSRQQFHNVDASDNVQRIRSYTTPLDATLQDWFYVGLATDESQRQCRLALCRKVVSFCSSSTSTMFMLLGQRDRLKDVADVILHHSIAPPTPPSANIPLSAQRTPPKSAATGLDIYRNFFEAPLMSSLATAFTSPAFFGWADFVSIPLAEKRDMALRVLEFATATLHPTSVEPVLKLFVSTVFTSPVDCLGCDGDTAARLSAALNCCAGNTIATDRHALVLQVSLDACALASFSPKLRANGFVLFESAVVLLAQSCGIAFDLSQLSAKLQELVSLPAHTSNFKVDALKHVQRAFDHVTQLWGRQLVDFIIQATSSERLKNSALRPSMALQALWVTVKRGVPMELFEECYTTKLIQRAMATAASPDTAAAEGSFAELFFPTATCPVRHSHRVRKLVADLASSAQLTSHCELVMAGADRSAVPPPSSMCVVSRIVAQEYLDKVTLPLTPQCLQQTLTVASHVYSSQYQPTRTVSWLAYKSQVTIARRGGAIDYTMSHAHFAVLEAVEDLVDHSTTPITVSLVANMLGVNAQHVMVLVEDLVEAQGLLSLSRPLPGHTSTPIDAVVSLTPDDVTCQRVATATVGPECATPIIPAAMTHVDVLHISSRRVARLRKRQQDRCRPALECSLLRLFKHSATPLPLDSAALIPLLLPLLPPAGFVVDPQEVEQAVHRLISRQYLHLNTLNNLVNYLV